MKLTVFMKVLISGTHGISSSRRKKDLNVSPSLWEETKLEFFCYGAILIIRNTFFALFFRPLPCVTFFFYQSHWFLGLKKVSHEALSCLVTKNFRSQSIDNMVLKSKKSMCDISEKCHVLFEWPLKTGKLLNEKNGWRMKI